ncbi:MAG: hypothetical protein AAB363_00865, partial [Planctomycetota bacterium]
MGVAIAMDIQDIIALSLVAAAAVYAGRALWRMLNGKTGCAPNCGCSDKPTPADATPAPSQRGLKRVPLVTLEQV